MREATAANLDSGSFRDRNSRVFVAGDEIYRGLTPRALEAWKAFEHQLYETLAADGRVVETELTASIPQQELSELNPDWVAVLRHRRIPFVSYPYEWSFSMLQDAALLQLDLQRDALKHDLTLKDATPFNVQFEGGRPVFIDVGSFEAWEAGEPWVGYTQFCEMFLYPLLLSAYKGVPFQPLLRGALDGIPSEFCAALMSKRDLLRPGVFFHVYLQAKLQARNADRQTSVKSELGTAGFGKDLILSNVERLRKLVSRLSWQRDESEWSHYAENLPSYEAADFEEKKRFVSTSLGSSQWDLAWDLGCNTGTFSKLAAEQAKYVVALDADRLAVERLYREIREGGIENILPLVFNLADPSPGLGWAGVERKPLWQRARPDVTLCLALIHHVVISANVPVPEFIGWLARLGGHLVIEFVGKQDPMVQKLLLNKRDDYRDLERDVFEDCLRQQFEILETQELPSGNRVLYFARSRSGGSA